jgi:hypothetical protein
MNYIEESAIVSKVDKFREKKTLPCGLIIPKFITYRTVYEFASFRQLHNINNISNIRAQAAIYKYYAIICLTDSEIQFIIDNYQSLLHFYAINAE